MSTAQIIELTGNWHSRFSSFVGYIGALARQWEKSTPVVQNLAAHIVADRYRHFLRQGVGEDLSIMTKLLEGDHPPLSGLADHIIVRETPDGGGKPAVVTFETGWSRIAVLHEYGYILQVTPQQRAALFDTIFVNTGLSAAEWLGGSDDKGNQGGFWIVPPRKHAHFLRSKELVEILGYVAKVLLGDRQTRASGIAEIIRLHDEGRPPSIPWRPPSPEEAAAAPDGITAVAMKTTRVGTVLRRRKA